MDEDRKLMESLRRTLYGESSSFRSPSNSEDLSSHPWPPLQPSLAMEEEFKWETENDAFPTIDASLPDSNENSGAEVAATSAATPAELRRRTKKPWQCSHCAVEKTPLKREGPEGPATLCNACGIRFRAGGLVPEYRPANSPTCSIERHSNLKEVLEEMREKSCSSSQDNSFTK